VRCVSFLRALGVAIRESSLGRVLDRDFPPLFVRHSANDFSVMCLKESAYTLQITVHELCMMQRFNAVRVSFEREADSPTC